MSTASVGDVELELGLDGDVASSQFTSPPTSTGPLAEDDLDRLFDLLSWSREDLDPDVPTAVDPRAPRR